MNATAPPKPAVILAAPINVEESRAQRLQRQQARFRDRGGIFVPTNRSTLLDILLGKVSPLKKPRRSASASPSRAKSTDNEASKPALRRSPRKQSQKTIDVVTEQLPAMTDGPESEVNKPIKKATSSKSSKSRPQKETKDPRKRTKKPRDGTSVVDESVVGTPTEKASKRTVDTSKEKKIDVDDNIEDDIPLVKSKAKGKAANKIKPKEVDPDDVGDDDFKSKSKSKVTSSQGKSKDDSAYKATKKSSTKKVLEDDVTCKPAKKPTKVSAALMEKGSCKSLEEHTLAKEDTTSESTSKAVVASSNGKKRTSTSIAQDLEPHQRRKLVKSGTADIDPSLHKDSNLSDEAPLIRSKKRRRNPKDAESDVEDGVDKGTKRKKHSSPLESRQSPEIIVEEDSVKPVAKRSRKVAKSTRKVKKQNSDNSTTISKQKENATSKRSKKVASISGPPKSVLQRIKNSLGAQVVDNEPDPIDFLS